MIDEPMNGDVGFYAEIPEVEVVEPEIREPELAHIAFTGSSAEYFRIWIVNIVLMLVTLGLYTPWAKVRTRRYFYLNTRIGGDSLDYLASPKKLLIGYLILAGFLACYNYLPTINPAFSIPVGLIGAIGFPWVIYKSRRFFCRNSAYRNIRFRFLGTLPQSYAAYLGIPILVGFTLGLAAPYVFFRQKEYFFEHVSFGGVKSDFSGTPGYFFKLYYGAVGIAILLGTGLALFISALGSLGESLFFAIIAAFYFFFFLITFVINAMVTKYCWNHTTFPRYARFYCTLHPLRLAWIQMSNIIVSAFSLGLLIPWAKVRLMRYRIENMQVVLYPEVDQVLADYRDQDDGAFGDLAADEFDFEIGL